MARRSTTNGSQMHGEIELLSEELGALGKQLARVGERAMADGTAKLNEEIGRLQERFESMRERVSTDGRRTAERLGETVQEHPLAALSAAFAIGAVIALLLGRRH